MKDILDMYNNYRTIAQGINEVRDDPNILSNKKYVALYIYNNKIVSIGVNKSKTHPLLLKYNYDTSYYYCEDNSMKNHKPQYPIHAELDGYIKILNQSIDFNKLFIYRGDNGVLPSMPCHVCAAWISKIEKLKIVYTTSDNNIECIYSKDLKGHYRRALLQRPIVEAIMI